MSPEKEMFHVVIRIPTKRPKGFVEPPSIVWTDEMEHKLWQYMSQKNTDWNVIAEQLGVPTSYIVRHAAFIYETQLRGIHQQLRLNVNNSSMTRASAKSPTPSLKKPISSRYSNTFQQQQYLQDTEAQKQSDPRNNNNTLSNSKNSADTVQQDLITSNDPPTALPLKTQRSPSESLYKSSMGRLHTETTAYIKEDSEDDDRSLDNDDDDEEDDGTDTKEDEEEDEEERFSSHFERMKLQVEEPAFLARRLEGSAGSLSASRNQLSLSIQNLRKPSNVFGGESSLGSPKKILSPQIHSPATRPSTAPGSNNESAINSSTSSFSDISETSVTQSAMEDAFLSNFDHAGGSKISSFMSFTRK